MRTNNWCGWFGQYRFTMGGCAGKSLKSHAFEVFSQPPSPQSTRPDVVNVLLIVNPFSGGKKGATVATRAETYLKARVCFTFSRFPRHVVSRAVIRR
jgi:hypothetical protein